MTEAKRPLKVFLCYAHSDKNAVESLYARLIQDGVDVRLDKNILPREKNWESGFRKTVHEADVVVICLSKQFNKVSYARKKIPVVLEAAREKPKGEFLIILASMEECTIPDRLVNYQRVSLFQPNGYEPLLDVLKGQEKDMGLAQPGKEKAAEMNSSIPNSNNGSDHGASIKGKRIRIAELIGVISSVIALVTFITGRETIAQFFQGGATSSPSEPALVVNHSVVDPTFTLTTPNGQTLSPSATTNPSLTPVKFTETVTLTPEPGYSIVDPQEVLNIAPNLRTLGQLAIEKYSIEDRNKINNTLTFTVNSTADVPILWRWFWCAVNDRVLEQNMTKISILFEADGYLIPEEQLATVVFENADPTYQGWKCLTYETVLRNWKPRTYKLIQTMTISSAINDGAEKFEAGYKIYEYTVNISP